MAERNATIEPSRRMHYRIGVNQGDVVFDEVRIYGDGVNVAARLEGIANARGVCVSGKVYDEIHGRLELAYEDIGPQQLKNIVEPVRVYRIDPAQPVFGQSQRRAPLPLPNKPSIAVLPFTNLSPDPSQDYFSDGITEDIIIELSRFSELFVIARNSSFQYKAKSVDVRQVGRELGVRYVLEGSIRRVPFLMPHTGQQRGPYSSTQIWLRPITS
jgi:adenylate cyclase